MTDILIPALIIFVVIYAMFAKVDPYASFVKGAKSSLSLIVTIVPYLIAMFIAIELFRVSGLSAIVCKVFAPLLRLIGIPTELTEFIIIRPFSGNSALVLLKDIFTTYGVDSYIARCAAVIMGSSDTVFYVCSIYFSGTSVKRTLLTLPISLLCSFIACILACLLCRVM